MDEPLHDLARAVGLATGHTPPASDRDVVMAAVDALFAAHQDVVYATCLRLMGSAEPAMDVAQDTLVLAWQKLPSFRGEARFSTWLVAIARYECLNALRRGRDLLTEDGVIEAADPLGSVMRGLRRQERAELLRDAAAAVLDATEQEAVHLRYVEHQPLAHIDTLLALPPHGDARVTLQRSKRKLATELRRRLAELGHGSSFVRSSVDDA
jgi:RNA polymerase sigma factor (sigma-70 family)